MLLWFRELAARICDLFRRKRLAADFDEEIQSHLEMLIEENLRRGMDSEEARRAAFVRLGGIGQIKERHHEQRGLAGFDVLFADVRHAFRTLAKSPGFTAVAILTLTLGIGANTAIFTVTDAVLLRSLPVQEPDRLATLTHPEWHDDLDALYCYRLYTELRARNTVFSGLLARSTWHRQFYVSIDGGHGELVSLELDSGNYFSVLGVRPFIGRTFSLEDERLPGNPVAVLSYNYWRDRFAADPAVIGKNIRILSHQFTIIGVTPPGFFGIEVGSAPAIRIPFTLTATLYPPGKGSQGNDNYLDDPMFDKNHTEWLQLVGRLKPGMSFQEAEASLRPLNKQIQLEDAQAASWAGTSMNRAGRQGFLDRKVAVSSAVRGFSVLRETFSEPLLILLALSGLVLLIACSTLANLLIARGVARRREIAVRVALGAGRLRLVRYILMEGLMVSCAGGFFGVFLAWWGAVALIAAAPGPTPIIRVTPDARVLGFVIGVSLLTGVLFGLAPLFQALRIQAADALKQEGGSLASNLSQVRLRRSLIVVQVALSVLLLSGATMFVRTLRSLKSVPSGLEITHVLQMAVKPNTTSLGNEGKSRSYYSELLRHLESLPGVQSAATSWVVLLDEFKYNWPIKIPDHQPLHADTKPVTSSFFQTMGLRLMAGRVWSPQDDYREKREAVVSESFARDVFGEANPIGQTLSTWTDRTYTIVGVVSDSDHHTNLREADSRAVYLSPWGFWNRDLEVYVRTTKDPAKLAVDIRREAQSINSDADVSNVITMEEQVDKLLTRERLVAQLSSIFGLLAALLAAIGLYGIIAHSVAGRTREIGLRVALGAGRAHVQWLVLREVFILIGAGVALGVPAALAFTRLIGNLLFNVSPSDPISIAGAGLLMGLIALAAGYLPARRATRVDPMIALRCDG